MTTLDPPCRLSMLALSPTLHQFLIHHLMTLPFGDDPNRAHDVWTSTGTRLHALDATDGATSASSLLEEIVITGDQDISVSDITQTNTNAIESIDASGLTGALTASLANLSNGGTLELGSGADRITVTDDSTVTAGDATGSDVETIVGFEKSTSTTDADMIDDADQLVFSGASITADATGTGFEIADGVMSFTGAGPATLEDAFDLADTALQTAAGESVVFEYTGDTYAFIEGDGSAGTATDTLVKLAGVTDVDSLNLNGGGDLYIA